MSSNRCAICGKGVASGNKVCFSNKKFKRQWKPNLKRVRAIIDGRRQRAHVCTRCIRSGKVERA